MIQVLSCFSLLTCIVSSKYFLIETEDGNDPLGLVYKANTSISRSRLREVGNDYSNYMDSSESDSGSSSSSCHQCGEELDCGGGGDYIHNGEATKVR